MARDRWTSRRRLRASWPRPTAAAQSWTIKYGLIAYVLSWVVPFALIITLGAAFKVNLEGWRSTLLLDAAELAALIPLWRSGLLAPKDLGLRRVPGARSVAYVLLAVVAVGMFDRFWRSLLGGPSRAGVFAGISHESAISIGLAAFTAAVSAPVVEEIFSRGLIYRCLRNRLPVLAAAVIAGAMFGLRHAAGDPLDVLPTQAFFGFVACLLYERTGSLLPGIALHSFIDAGSFEFAATRSVSIVLWAFLGLAVVLLVRGLWHELRSSHPKTSEQASAVLRM